MDHLEIATELKRNLKVFKSLLHGLTHEQYLWRPEPEKWCLLEVICHLYDEEREDFGARVKHVLQDPDKPLPAIDPQGWVISRKYMQQDYELMLKKFLGERDESVAYLESLSSPRWGNTHMHPKFGPMSAKLFLNNWLAHDYLHFRQITAIKYGYLKAKTKDTLSYAGDW